MGKAVVSGRVRFDELHPVMQRTLAGATVRFAKRAMQDPVLWARVQALKEEMYADGRLEIEEADCAQRTVFRSV